MFAGQKLDCPVWSIVPSFHCTAPVIVSDRKSELRTMNRSDSDHSTNKLAPKLSKAPQPPLSHAGAAPDSDRVKRGRDAAP